MLIFEHLIYLHNLFKNIYDLFFRIKNGKFLKDVYLSRRIKHSSLKSSVGGNSKTQSLYFYFNAS